VDVELYAILRSDYLEQNEKKPARKTP